jgi:hypothetical protein
MLADGHVDYAYKTTILQHREIEITAGLICPYGYPKVDSSQASFSGSLQDDLSSGNSTVTGHGHSILVPDTNGRK